MKKPSKKKLIELYEMAGLTTKEVGQVLKIPYWTVEKWLKRYGMVRRPQGHNFVSKNIRLPDEGWKWAYFAGIVDGEGCITIVSNGQIDKKQKMALTAPNKRLQFTIANTDKSLMDWLLINFGGAFTMHANRSPKDSSRRVLDSYEWRCNSISNAYPLLIRLEKYLVVKKWAARRALMFCRHRMREHGYDPDVDYAALRAKYLTSDYHVVVRR